ncbi:MAG TPA: Ig-like domain-containing protein [Geobacteraceae bacterium]
MNGTIFARFTSCLLLLMTMVVVAACIKEGESTNRPPAPVVSATAPANGATGVFLNDAVAVFFSKDMNPASVNGTTFTVSSNTGAVAGTVTASGASAVFKPAAQLTPSTTFTVTVTTGAQDTAGIPLASNVTWTFTTGTTTDAASPTITAIVPANNATGVALNASVAATFSETMDPTTMTPAAFTVTSGAGPVAGTITLSGTAATFTPNVPLAQNTTYTATVTTGAKDLAGNPLLGNFSWSFSTGQFLSPTVTATVPVNGATNVPTGSTITATFSKAMDPATVNQFTFTLSSGFPVQGTVTLDGTGTIATFTPVGPLLTNTLHTATITTGAKDLAGNPLAAPFTWSFTTGSL